MGKCARALETAAGQPAAVSELGGHEVLVACPSPGPTNADGERAVVQTSRAPPCRCWTLSPPVADGESVHLAVGRVRALCQDR